MNREERNKLILNLTNFINENRDMFKATYELFSKGKSKINTDKYEYCIEAPNFNELKKPEDPLFNTIFLFYISMKQLLNPNDKELTLDINECKEISYFSDYLKENSENIKNLIKEIENTEVNNE